MEHSATIRVVMHIASNFYCPTSGERNYPFQAVYLIARWNQIFSLPTALQTRGINVCFLFST